MAILVVGAAFSSSSCGGDGVHWAAFHEALNNVDSAASLCGRIVADNRGQPVLDFGLLARPERAAAAGRRVAPGAASHGPDRERAKATARRTRAKPQPRKRSASARAASSAKKTSDSRDGGRISLNEDRIDAALRAAISTMGDGVRAPLVSATPFARAEVGLDTFLGCSMARAVVEELCTFVGARR